MKKIFASALFIAAIGLAAPAMSQTKDTTSVGKSIKKTAKKVGHTTAKTASTVGNATAETASKGASKVVDKTYKGKVGPDGQTIYINNKSQYYYVNDKGGKVFVTKAELKDKM